MAITNSFSLLCNEEKVAATVDTVAKEDKKQLKLAAKKEKAAAKKKMEKVNQNFWSNPEMMRAKRIYFPPYVPPTKDDDEKTMAEMVFIQRKGRRNNYRGDYRGNQLSNNRDYRQDNNIAPNESKGAEKDWKSVNSSPASCCQSSSGEGIIADNNGVATKPIVALTAAEIVRRSLFVLPIHPRYIAKKKENTSWAYEEQKEKKKGGAEVQKEKKKGVAEVQNLKENNNAASFNSNQRNSASFNSNQRNAANAASFNPNQRNAASFNSNQRNAASFNSNQRNAASFNPNQRKPFPIIPVAVPVKVPEYTDQFPALSGVKVKP